MNELSLGRYIFERLHQLNVRTIFGVPGDFNLTLLDKIYETDSAHGKGSMIWAGNCNELNAAYAADGYSRVNTGKIGVLVTTFGVGYVFIVEVVIFFFFATHTNQALTIIIHLENFPL